MNNFRAVRWGIAAASVVMSVTAIARQPVPKPPILVTGARILDVAKGRYLASVAILIQDGRIASVAPEPPTSLPPSTTRLSADGAVIVPGLIDAHAWAAPTPDLDADYFYLMGLAHGVTGYRVLDVRTAWGVSQRARAASGSILAPRLWTSGGGINQGASPDRWLLDAPDAAAAAREVSRQVDATVNWIAGHDALGPEMYKAMVLEARRSGVRVSGEPGASSMADLASAGVSSIEMLAYPLKPASGPADQAWLAAGAKDLATLQTRLVRGRITLVPMMAAAMLRAFPEEVAKDPALALLPEARRAELMAALKKAPAADVARAQRAWASEAAFLKRLVQAGGRVAAGTGFELSGYPVPGVGLHREMAALVRAGLTPADALRAATVTAADLVGAPPGMIRLAPGAEADFIVVKGDPLKQIDDLTSITYVVRAGEVLDPKSLLARAKQAAAPRPR